MVVPRDIKDISWRHRHGPILRAIMFHHWCGTNEASIANTFLYLSPHDPPFRAMAYAILCLAAGGSHIRLLPSRNVSANDTYGFVGEWLENNEKSEFVRVLTSRPQAQALSPSTAPEGTLYWLDNILVVLIDQLYRPETADAGISRIVLYCQKHHSSVYVDAVLISVEHVVLVRVVPGGKVQHTAAMPLIDRYARPYHQRLAAENERLPKGMSKAVGNTRVKRPAQDEAVELGRGINSNEEGESDDEDGSKLYTTRLDNNINSAFYALVHLFEGGACRHMSATEVDVPLPDEIYSQIIEYTTDMETRLSLIKVSRAFRRACQEDLLFDEGLIIKPSPTCQSCDEPQRTPKWFEKYDVDSGIRSRVAWRRDLKHRIHNVDPSAATMKRSRGDSDKAGASRKVAVGTERNKRSLLADVAFEFVELGFVLGNR